MTYAIHVKRLPNGIEIIFQNDSIQRIDAAIKAEQDRARRITDLLGRLPEERVAQLKKELSRRESTAANLRKVRIHHAKMPARVVFVGGFELAVPATSHLKATGEKTDDGMQIEIIFGQKSTNFIVEDEEFKPSK